MRVDPLEQRVEHLDLVGDLGAAEHRDVRPVDVAEQPRQEVDLLGHHEAGALLGDELDHARGRRVGAVRGAERVVDVDVAVRRERARELLVVGLLAGMEAQVLEHRDLAVAQVADDLARAVADRLVGERDVELEQLGEPRGDRLERDSGLAWPSGRPRCEPSTMRAPRSIRWLERRQRGADARVVGDLRAVVALSSGTLKSTRTNTRLPSTGELGDVLDARRAGPSQLLRDEPREVEQALRVAHLVVVPGHAP